MNNWFIVGITLLLSAFFSGMEIAFVTSNKLRIELDKSKGIFPANLISGFIHKPSRFIGAMLFGNNLALVIYGLAMASLLRPALLASLPGAYHTELTILLLQTFISTLIILILAEFLPKILFRLSPNNLLNFFALPAYLFYYIFYPFNLLFIWIAEALLKYVFGVKFNPQGYVFSPIDLDEYIKESSQGRDEENTEEQEIQMFQNAIDFRNAKVRECMVPRTEISALDEDEPIPTLLQEFISTGHSKILIYRDSIDNIIGYAHSFDLFSNPATIRSIIRPVLIVPETILAHKVLSMFINEHKSVAIVMDEFGGTSGMATLEDLIEEIFGEIDDEFDTEALEDIQKSEKEFILSGRLEIDYLNSKYNLGLPETDEYETLGGFIIHHHESIPAVNDIIIVPPFTFTILSAGETRIEKVLLTLGD
jgi:CBS domain containing-hemolysin-like protein